MVRLLQLLGPVAVIFLAGPVASHPGETHDASEMEHQILARNQIASVAKKSLDACMGSVEAQQLRSRNVVRRANIAEELRQKRGITTNARKWRRDLATLEIYEAINHNETGIDYYKPGTPGDVVFAANTSCILTPEVTNGPYYIRGERIRKNVKEDKYSDGVDLYLEVQYLDIDTCKPIPDIYVDIWSANATGIYSGISISDSFGTNYAADGWDSTYLRGIQPTDKDGVAAFETIFPGHYTGRATHTHLLSHMNVTVNQNHTLLNGTGTVTHVGQLFYNEVLRNAVEATYPYNTNTDPVTSNADDRFSIVQASNDYDPFPEFLYLGDSITDGLFAWIQIGINTSADQSYTLPIAGWYEADGGHENPEGPQSLDES